MAHGDIDDEIRDFLLRHVEAYEDLTALLCVCGDRQKVWTDAALSELLRLKSADALAALERLRVGGLLEARVEGKSASYRYAPASAEVDAVVQRLASIVDEKRLEILKLLSANAMERVRTAAMRTFADAFLLGRKKRDG